MKASTLLAGSLLANLALLAALALRPSFAPPAVRDFIVEHFHPGGGQPATAASAAVPVSGSARGAASRSTGSSISDSRRLLGAAFETDDPLVLQARLRAAGFPPGVIVEIGRREIDVRFNARLLALTNPDPNTPFWKTSADVLAAAGRRNEQISQIHRERDKAWRDFVNDPIFFHDAALDIGQRRMWGDLPREKLDRIQRIDDDYTDMMGAVRTAANGVILPADREKLALLEREKKADIEASLAPDELAEYRFRTAAAALQLNGRFPLIQLSETEFRAIAQAQFDLSGKYTFANGAPVLEQNQARSAQQAFEAQVKAAIGDARYAEYLRNTNNEFTQLSSLAERDRLPSANLSQAFSVRDRVAQESNRIFDDSSLDAAQKAAALQALAQTTRAQLLSLLGPTSGPAYLKVADNWLSNVERGAAVVFNPTAVMNIGNDRVILTGSGSTTFRRPPGAAPTNPGVSTGWSLRSAP
ncbi:MAG: hypothetical protein ABIO94_12570 [Opitutaceae bacterium]